MIADMLRKNKKYKENIFLNKYEVENIEDCIPIIEKMYQFKFGKGETESVKNFDAFCDLIINKIHLENIESCTTQQAFYKLRNSLIEEKISDKGKIKLETKLNEILPRKNRIELVKKVENNIGFKLNILQPPNFIINTLVLILLASFISLFIDFNFGIIGIGITFFCFYLSRLFGKELRIDTFKELIEEITTENYLKVRRNVNTVNKSELKEILTNWFAENSGIEKGKLQNSTFD